MDLTALPLALALAFRIAAPSPEAARQPQLAVQGSRVAVAFGAGNSVYVSGSDDSGRSFRPPVLVSSEGQLALGMHRGPRVAFAGSTIVISAIVGHAGRGRDGDLLAWTSTDGGRTWSRPVRINDVAGSAREGLHAMAAGKDVLFSAWLDLREKGTRVYGAASRDGGRTWSPNRLVYQSPSGTVCTCCHPSVAVDAEGRIFVMFRNALEGARDLYLSRSTDGGQTFEAARKLGSGTWRLEACPMDGGGLSLDERGRVLTAWRREATVFATSDDGPEEPIGAGKNPVIAVTRGGRFVAWTREGAVVIGAPGTAAETVAVPGAFPSLAGLDDGSLLAAWETDGAVEVETLPSPGPHAP